jgi:hypothetical protein
MNTVEFRSESSIGHGSHIAVVVNGHHIGRLERTVLGRWHYFSSSHELRPEIRAENLTTLKARVIEKFK